MSHHGVCTLEIMNKAGGGGGGGGGSFEPKEIAYWGETRGGGHQAGGWT